MPFFIFESKNHNLYKSYITQEFLKKGIMASNVIYVSVVHSKKLIDEYLNSLDFIFKKIKDSEIKNKKIVVNGKLAQVGMSRLNWQKYYITKNKTFEKKIKIFL